MSTKSNTEESPKDSPTERPIVSTLKKTMIPDKAPTQKIAAAVPTKPSRPNVGDTVKGKYKVTKVLGEGGFGIVLKVHDIKSNEYYAMKVSNYDLN